ncbi:MAG: MCE family protein [Muribaculaceae bacterium]|nr:MCE family protein [Muribaculaceae bacterium]
MKSFFSKNVIIALVVIAALGLLFWGIEYLKGVNLFKPTNFYTAHFEQVDGLNVSSPVTINGFKVGQVSEISYDYESNRILVEMSMDKGLKIPVGTTISLSSGLMGGASLELHLANNPTYLNVGDEIQGTVQAGLMDAVTDNVMPQVTVMLPKVDSILSNVNAVTSNPALQTSVARLDGITAELAASSQQLSQLMRQLNASVPGVMTNVDGVTSKLNTSAGDLNAVTGKLKTMPLDSTINSINATVANLEQLTKKINGTDSSLGLLLNDRQLYNNANSAVQSLDSLLQDVKANPKRYITIKVF